MKVSIQNQAMIKVVIILCTLTGVHSSVVQTRHVTIESMTRGVSTKGEKQVNVIISSIFSVLAAGEEHP